MNKQLIIHVATEIIVVGTVTVFLNKRITKLEKALLEQQYKNRELELRLQHIEQLISSSPPRQHQIPTKPYHSQQQSHSHQHPRPHHVNDNPQSQQNMFDFNIPMGLQYLFGVPPERVRRQPHTTEEKTPSVNVEVIQEEEKNEVTPTVVVENEEEDEKIVEEALHSILSE